MSAATLEALASRFPAAGIGCQTGPSCLTVVDLDAGDPALRREIVRRFGEPGVEATTPSDGLHLFYRGGTARNCVRNVPGFEGEPVDVKSKGGFLILPPTRSSRGRYTWSRGGWEDFRCLPPIDDSLFADPSRNANQPTKGEGSRNTFLFTEARRAIFDYTVAATHDALTDYLHSLNASRCNPPLAESEVLAVASNVLRYHEAGRLAPPAGSDDPALLLPASVYDAGRAVRELYLYLKRNHGPHHRFAISARAVGKTLSMRAESVIKATRALQEMGFIRLLLEAGPYDPRARRRPAEYAFATRGISSGIAAFSEPLDRRRLRQT